MRIKRPRETNDSGFTQIGYIKRVQKIKHEHGSLLGANWRTEWNDICGDFWRFDFAPEQALRAIEEKEHVADD